MESCSESLCCDLRGNDRDTIARVPVLKHRVGAISRLSLTAPAPHRGALTNRRVLQHPPTLLAGLAFAPVHREFLLEIARRTIRADEVAQGSPAALDGIRQDVFHCVSQTPIPRQRHFSRLAQRTDSRPMQAFGSVDISNPDNHGLIHQKVLTAARRLVPVRGDNRQ